MIALRILCICVLAYRASACLGKHKSPPNLGDPFQRLVGKDVKQSPYTGAGDHPVASCDELTCNFDSACCWSNANPPTDQLDWVTLSGPGENAKMQKSFGTTNQADGSYLGVASASGAKANKQTAQFYSCPIQCAEGQITVSMRHWQTKDIDLQVCEEDSPDGPTSNCQPLNKKSGEQDTATLAGGSNKRIVILATGFTELKGSVAMIDDINVQCTPCGVPPAAAPPVRSGGGNACSRITCNFESGSPCAYNTAQGSGGSKTWQVVKAPYQNPVTGVPTAADGSSFAGAYLEPKDTAVMSTDVNYPENYIVKFHGYRATEGMDLSACCGSPDNCPFSTTNQVQVADYKNWQPATITCPPGTKRVLFLAKNSGKNVGAAGLDNVQLLVPGGQQVPC